jgi:hypothetical protein
MLLCQPLIFNSIMYMDWVATIQFTKAAVTGINKVTSEHSVSANTLWFHVHPVAG